MCMHVCMYMCMYVPIFSGKRTSKFWKMPRSSINSTLWINPDVWYATLKNTLKWLMPEVYHTCDMPEIYHSKMIDICQRHRCIYNRTECIICIKAFRNVFTCLCVCVCVCVYMGTHIQPCVCMYVCMYIFLRWSRCWQNVCMYIYIYIYIYVILSWSRYRQPCC